MLRIIRNINEAFVIASLYDKANDGVRDKCVAKC